MRMSGTGWIAGFLVVSALAVVTAEAAVPFSRYEVILQRQPFGEPPAAPVTTSFVRPSGPPPPPFTKELRMCGITESESFGLRVGIVDIKTQKSYYFRIGDSEDGIELVDADFDKEACLLRKNGDEQWLLMNGQTSSESPRGSTPAGVPISTSYRGSSSPANLDARMTFAERLRVRREEIRKKMSAPPKLSGEDLKKHLEEYQMDVIRKGLPALPIPLTQEMDDQLVKEGVLPPIDGDAIPQ